MPFTYIDPPGVETEVGEGKAGVISLDATRKISRDHTLRLGIYRTTLYNGCLVSSKLLPLVVAMWERNNRIRTVWNDFYSFDHNGVLLSHGYSMWREGQKTVNEKHDLSLERLMGNGEHIQYMIGEVPLPAQLAMHFTVTDLRQNTLGKD